MIVLILLLILSGNIYAKSGNIYAKDAFTIEYGTYSKVIPVDVWQTVKGYLVDLDSNRLRALEKAKVISNYAIKIGTTVVKIKQEGSFSELLNEWIAKEELWQEQVLRAEKLGRSYRRIPAANEIKKRKKQVEKRIYK
jgi:hypothetical protein